MTSALPNNDLQARPAYLPGSAPRRVDRWFYIGVAVVAILLSIAGFGPSIVDTSLRRGSVTALAVAHAALVSSWLLVFLTQAYLVATRRIRVHRRLGVLGALLAAVVIVVTFVASVETTRRGHDLSGDIARAAGGSLTADGLLFPLVSLFNFGILVTAALFYRQQPEVHKRLMLFALLQPLVAEPLHHLYGHLAGHWPALQQTFAIFAIPSTLILLSVSAIHDRFVQRRIHPVSIWVPIALLVWTNVLFAVVLPSAVWLRIAEWLIRAPA
jgi:hypothetical protein